MKGWGWFGLGLIALFFIVIFLILVPSAIGITLTRPGYLYSDFFICQTCHGVGEAAYKIKPKIPAEGECVLPKEEMRAKHGKLLYEWKGRVVREGERIYIIYGKKWEISFEKTCLSCHEDFEKSCQPCHTQGRVKLNCLSCHVKPGV